MYLNFYKKQYATTTLKISDKSNNLENKEFLNLILDKLAVNFGKEILYKKICNYKDLLYQDMFQLKSMQD